MNPEKHYDKEIETICDTCGGQDGSHLCECGEELTAEQCEAQEGYCEQCAKKSFK